MIRKTHIALALAAACFATPAFADRDRFPDRPPGHQPPPGDCRELSRRVPHGAVLVEGG